MTRVLACCDDAPIPAAWRDADWDYRLQITALGTAPSVTLRVEDLSDALGAEVGQRALDLTHLAAYIYAADQLVSRGGVADLYGQSWRRSFAVCARVSAPDRWQDTAVMDALRATLHFVTDDDWQFAFASGFHAQPLFLGFDPRQTHSDPDSVYLFSGGADSLCAVVAAAETGERPVLVSHSPEPRVDHRQKLLRNGLRHRYPAWSFPHSTVIVNKKGVRERDTTQRTRSFLYASLGAAVAAALDLPRVVLADNGIVSLNLPVNAQLVGTLASRSTHPRFLSLFNRLLGALLDNAPRVENPLLLHTRAEALAILTETQTAGLLTDTRSCGSGRRLPGGASHCGTCSQCVDRRIGVRIAGLEAFDPLGHYATDIFSQALAGTDRTMVESYVRFARQVSELTPDALFEAYPQLVDAIVPGDPLPEDSAGRLCGLIQRYARAVNAVISETVAGRRVNPRRAAVTPSSLTAMVEHRVDEPLLSPGLPIPQLTPVEQKEFEAHHFSAPVPIQITGERIGRTSNEVKIGGTEVHLPNTEFVLLLRLIVALHETPDGFVDRGRMREGGGLAAEGIYPSDAIDRVTDSLRRLIKPVFPGLAGTQIIEVSHGRVRLSTHRAFVTVQRDRLLHHPDERVRTLAARLPVER